MDKAANKFFKKNYKNPVIEKYETDTSFTFPGLFFYSVFEKENLAEDPLIPHIWVTTSKKHFYRTYDLEKALEEENIIPSNEQEAFKYSRNFVKHRYNLYYYIADNQVDSDVIPEKYLKEEFYPKTEKINGNYRVRIYFYYPNRRFAEFFSLYKNVLVEYIVDIDGATYKITTEKEIK